MSPPTDAPAELTPRPSLETMTPRDIVVELDKYVVGQAARQAGGGDRLAQSLAPTADRRSDGRRDRSQEHPDDRPDRRRQTEIARRLAKLASAPFIKVEASKFTEVGYIGRDVESMVRDLVEIAIGMIKEEWRRSVEEAVDARARRGCSNCCYPSPS